MKIDRLIGIVVYLLNHGRTSAQKLAEEFEVSSRTITRDLESLDQAGIPIQSFCGVDGGYQIMDSFVLDRQVASSREYDWIVAALKGMASAYAGKSLKQALEKVQSMSHTEEAIFSMDLGVASEDDKIKGQLMLLEKAIEEKCVVRFSYTNSHGEIKEIQVEPVCLQYKWYNWYLIAYYEKYQDYCMFKLVRMDKLQATDMKFMNGHKLSDIKLKDSTDRIVHIRLYGKAAIKAKCREYLNGRITQEFENGDFEFSFSVPEHETFWYGVILSFGNKARIIEPQEIKERILKTCKEIQMEYESGGR
jgi:predicted DNA-binding transcriptional regulator YafY